MKSFKELLQNTRRFGEAYTSDFENEVEENNKFLDLEMDEKADAIKEYIFTRAIVKEKFNDQQLVVLYEMLNTKDSPLDIMTRAMATSGARDAESRYNELHSAYFKDVVFKSAKDGYSHASKNEMIDYFNSLVDEKPDLRGMQRERELTGRKIPKREPEHRVFSAKELSDFSNEPENKKVMDKVKASGSFSKTFDVFKEKLKVEMDFLKEDAAYRKSKKAHTNTSYDELITAVDNMSKALESDKPNEIHQRALELKEKARIYKESHKGFIRGNLPKGRKRYNASFRIESIMDLAVPKLEKSFREANGSEMSADTDATITAIKDNVTRESGPVCDRYQAMKDINKAYNDAVNKTISEAYYNVRNKESNFLDEEKDVFFNKQKENLTDVLARAIAVENLKNDGKDIITGSDVAENIQNAPKTIFDEKNIASKTEIVKNSENFKKFVDNIKNIDDVDKLTKNIKKGNLAGVAKEYNKQLDAVKQHKKTAVMK